MTDWLATITDPKLRRIAILEREVRGLHRRADNLAATARILAIAVIATNISMWILVLR